MARKCFLRIGLLLVVASTIPATSSAQQASTLSPAALDQLQQTARQAINHISDSHVEKWKTDSGTKRAAQADADALQRNMESALPELILNVRNAPQDLNANFKLYRNIDVLYDVFSRFTETTGAFGPKEDYKTLTQDLAGLQDFRHLLGDTLDGLTVSVQGELERMRAQIRAAQQAPLAPPKKVVIDDSQPTPTHRRKPPSKSTTSGQTAAQPSPSPTPQVPH